MEDEEIHEDDHLEENTELENQLQYGDLVIPKQNDLMIENQVELMMLVCGGQELTSARSIIYDNLFAFLCCLAGDAVVENARMSTVHLFEQFGVM